MEISCTIFSGKFSKILSLVILVSLSFWSKLRYIKGLTVTLRDADRSWGPRAWSGIVRGEIFLDIIRCRWNNFAVNIGFLKSTDSNHIAPNSESSGTESNPFVLKSSLYYTEPRCTRKCSIYNGYNRCKHNHTHCAIFFAWYSGVNTKIEKRVKKLFMNILQCKVFNMAAKSMWWIMRFGRQTVFFMITQIWNALWLVKVKLTALIAQ